MQLWNRVDKRLLEKQLLSEDRKRVTISFYKYHKITDPQTWRDELYQELDKLEVLGRIYVAQEGINAQLSVPAQHFDDGGH